MNPKKIQKKHYTGALKAAIAALNRDYITLSNPNRSLCQRLSMMVKSK